MMQWEKKKVAEEIAKAKRETAKEILDKVYDWGQGFFIEHSLMEEDEFNGILDEIAKQYNAEVQNDG